MVTKKFHTSNGSIFDDEAEAIQYENECVSAKAVVDRLMEEITESYQKIQKIAQDLNHTVKIGVEDNTMYLAVSDPNAKWVCSPENVLGDECLMFKVLAEKIYEASEKYRVSYELDIGNVSGEVRPSALGADHEWWDFDDQMWVNSSTYC